MGNIDQINKADFGFQWHITDRCNLRCTHCYQDDYSGSNEMRLDDLKRIPDETIRTLSKWNKRGDIAVTGGEPLIKRETCPLIHYLESAHVYATIWLIVHLFISLTQQMKQSQRPVLRQKQPLTRGLKLSLTCFQRIGRNNQLPRQWQLQQQSQLHS